MRGYKSLLIIPYLTYLLSLTYLSINLSYLLPLGCKITAHAQLFTHNLFILKYSIYLVILFN
jgi:hypothetical protein